MQRINPFDATHCSLNCQFSRVTTCIAREPAEVIAVDGKMYLRTAFCVENAVQRGGLVCLPVVNGVDPVKD
jgi:hypothetical protein